MNIAFVFGRKVAEPSVSMHRAARFDGLLQEGHEAIGGCVLNALHANSADAPPLFLRSDCYQGFALSLSPSNSLFQASQVGLVYFDPPCQPVSARPNHRSPELVQPGPGRLVAAKPQHPLQSEGTGPVLLARP